MQSIREIVLGQLAAELETQNAAQKDEIETSKHFKGAMESRYNTFKEDAKQDASCWAKGYGNWKKHPDDKNDEQRGQ